MIELPRLLADKHCVEAFLEIRNPMASCYKSWRLATSYHSHSINLVADFPHEKRCVCPNNVMRGGVTLWQSANRKSTTHSWFPMVFVWTMVIFHPGKHLPVSRSCRSCYRGRPFRLATRTSISVAPYPWIIGCTTGPGNVDVPHLSSPAAQRTAHPRSLPLAEWNPGPVESVVHQQLMRLESANEESKDFWWIRIVLGFSDIDGIILG